MLSRRLLLLNKHQILKSAHYALCFRGFHSSLIRANLFNKEPFQVFQPLQQQAPTFHMNGEQIQLLYEPTDFYKEIKSRILSAKKRIFIAALYIGQSENELVDTLRQALSQSKELKVHILIDCLRGTRISKSASSATLLSSLIESFPDQIQVSMYHTPDLKGVLKKTLPPRFNETIGLMHLKVYGFDDTVMLSGANLSTDYFTNRQDRYMLFHDQHLTNYYHDLLNVVSSFSYQLTKDQQLLLLPSTYDPVRQSSSFKQQAKLHLLDFIEKYQSQPQPQQSNLKEKEKDTIVLPVIQMGPFDIQQDERVTLSLLGMAHHHQHEHHHASKLNWHIHLTSGYFNFTNRYKQFILNTRAIFKFLTASPEANGFFNSKGVSRYLPPAYTYIEKQFYRQVIKSGRQDTISIEEYKRPGWTYHAKGLWIQFKEDQYPSVTMIGSPNFGHRSSRRDLEAQVVLFTDNKSLQTSLHKEVDSLHHYSTPISDETFQQKDRYVPYGVRVATTFIKTML
ncbi:hypothetical protein BJ944DRAFT_271913 [Cunninghamella echinulata]|nr:hypothetical protein BJ944DRAFT_271913 [Cunninghamella echinulata]